MPRLSVVGIPGIHAGEDVNHNPSILILRLCLRCFLSPWHARLWRYENGQS